MNEPFEHLTDLLQWNQTRGVASSVCPALALVPGEGDVHLDADSAYVRQCIAGNSVFEGPYEEFTRDELELASARLTQALQKIFATNSRSLSMIEGSLRAIGIRKSSRQPTAHGLTRSQRVGTVFIRNPQGSATGVTELSEIIVHECLHSYLWTLERTTPILTYGQRAMIEQSIPSAWTGKHIEVYAYFHAIAVWFCLAHFLGSLPESRSDSWIERRIAMIRAGFLRMDEEPYASVNRLASLEPSFARAIVRMTGIMQKSSR